MEFNLQSIMKRPVKMRNGVYLLSENSNESGQEQTNEAFSSKWLAYNKEKNDDKEKFYEIQRKWFLNLYGFKNEKSLREYLTTKRIILDAGCGLGYKAKYFSDLSPDTIVLAMDYSDSVFEAQKKYRDTPNLIFIKGDIARTGIKEKTLDFICCDQVLHHTENPADTIKSLSKTLKPSSEIAVYVYSKKAVPRELLDDYFRKQTKNITSDDMWELSEQLTELGKTLSNLNIEIEVPSIPLLNIKGGKVDLQRFLYWNFLKCYWNSELGYKTSVMTNYDWYAPSNAYRYSKKEFLTMTNNANLSIKYIHHEEACHSGRFYKT